MKVKQCEVAQEVERMVYDDHLKVKVALLIAAKKYHRDFGDIKLICSLFSGRLAKRFNYDL